jgi:amidase
MDQLNAASRRIAAFFQQYDLLVTPTCTRRAFGHGEFDMSREDVDALQWAKQCFALEVFLVPFNVTGQPAISLPLEHGPDGMPIGIQFVGRAGNEALLFRLAAALEAARPWSGRRPPVHHAV